jgi:hypothetical protein
MYSYFERKIILTYQLRKLLESARFILDVICSYGSFIRRYRNLIYNNQLSAKFPKFLALVEWLFL